MVAPVLVLAFNTALLILNVLNLIFGHNKLAIIGIVAASVGMYYSVKTIRTWRRLGVLKTYTEDLDEYVINAFRSNE